MKNKLLAFLLIISFLSTTNSCVSKEKKNRLDEVASINSEKIYIEEVDLLIKQELYKKLYQIYLIRKNKIQEVISKKTIQLESKKYKMSPDSLLSLYIYSKIDKHRVLSFASDNHYDTTGLVYQINCVQKTKIPNTEEGSLLEKYQDFQLRKYLDSLNILYKVSYNIQPPSLPKELSDNILAHYKGNLSSMVTFWLFSDIECRSCQESKPIYDSIFQKYKNRIRYAFSYYSDNVTVSSLALECASSQNKFWDMYNLLSNTTVIPTLSYTLILANKIGLNTKEFITEMQDSMTYHALYDNFKRINKAGFYGTPSVMINNRVISSPTSREEIENIIDYELSKQK